MTEEITQPKKVNKWSRIALLDDIKKDALTIEAQNIVEERLKKGSKWFTRASFEDIKRECLTNKAQNTWRRIVCLNDIQWEYLTEEAKKTIKDEEQYELEHPFINKYGGVVKFMIFTIIVILLAVFIGAKIVGIY